MNEQKDRLQTQQGIALFRISYEMDVDGSRKKDHSYTAGVIAYTSDEAVETLRQFCLKNVKGFVGFRIDQVGFEGYCHAISDSVRNEVIKGAVRDGLVTYPQTEEKEPKPKTTKTTKRKIVKG